MEIYEVTYKNELARVKKYPSDYYDIDGKIAFRVVIEENVHTVVVMAKNIEAVRNVYKEETHTCNGFTKRTLYDVEIKHLRSEENQFEALFPDDKVTTVKPQKTKTTRDIREEDAFCADEVQERYSKLDDSGKEYMRTHREYSDF